MSKHLHTLLLNGVNLEPGKSRNMSQYAKLLLHAGKKKNATIEEDNRAVVSSSEKNSNCCFPQKIFQDPDVMFAYKNTLGMCRQFLNTKDKSLALAKERYFNVKKRGGQKLSDRDCFTLLNDKAKILNIAGTDDDLFRSVCISSKKSELGKFFGKDYNRNKKFDFIRQVQNVHSKKVNKWPVKRINSYKTRSMEEIKLKKNASKQIVTRRNKHKYDMAGLRMKLLSQNRKPREDLSLSMAPSTKKDLGTVPNEYTYSRRGRYSNGRVKRVSSMHLIENIQRLAHKKDDKKRFLKLSNTPVESLNIESNALSKQYFSEFNRIQKTLDSLLHEYNAMKAMLKTHKSDADLAIKDPGIVETKKETQPQESFLKFNDPIHPVEPQTWNGFGEYELKKNLVPQQPQPTNKETKVYEYKHDSAIQDQKQLDAIPPNEPVEVISSKANEEEENPLPYLTSPQVQNMNDEIFNHQNQKEECIGCKPKNDRYKLKMRKPLSNGVPTLASARKWFTEVENKNARLNILLNDPEENTFNIKFSKAKHDNPKREPNIYNNIKENNSIVKYEKNTKSSNIMVEENKIKEAKNYAQKVTDTPIEENNQVQFNLQPIEEENIKLEKNIKEENNNIVKNEIMTINSDIKVEENTIKEAKNYVKNETDVIKLKDQNTIEITEDNLQKIKKEDNGLKINENITEETCICKTDEHSKIEDKSTKNEEQSVYKLDCLEKEENSVNPKLEKNGIIKEETPKKEENIAKLQESSITKKKNSIKLEDSNIKLDEERNMHNLKNKCNKKEAIKEEIPKKKENMYKFKDDSCLKENDSIFKMEKINIKNIENIMPENINIKETSIMKGMENIKLEENFIREESDIKEKQDLKEIGTFVLRTSACKKFDSTSKRPVVTNEVFLKTDIKTKPDTDQNINVIKRLILCIYRDCNTNKQNLPENFLNNPNREASFNCLKEIVPGTENDNANFYIKRSNNCHIYCKGSLKSKQSLTETSESNTNKEMYGMPQKQKESTGYCSKNDLRSTKFVTKRENGNIWVVNATNTFVVNNFIVPNPLLKRVESINNDLPEKTDDDKNTNVNEAIDNVNSKEVVELFTTQTPENKEFPEKLNRLKSPKKEESTSYFAKAETFIELYKKEFLKDVKSKVDIEDKKLLNTISGCMDSAYKRFSDQTAKEKAFKKLISYRVHDPYFEENEREIKGNRDLFVQVKSSALKKPEYETPDVDENKFSKPSAQNKVVLSDKDLFNKLQRQHIAKEIETKSKIIQEIAKLPEVETTDPIRLEKVEDLKEKSTSLLERMEESTAVQMLKKVSVSLRDLANQILRIDDSKPEMLLRE
ncbi:unnamed protein product [Brassicogethes aeneus]|uniref:Uncharacterized protein n=1 Tax=Brassicogethes aeneus TaxID=1431903 RepID=A0A9P0ANC4_BRAAE|nr:unnamed protein product [Brassicogethes aeneus]